MAELRGESALADGGPAIHDVFKPRSYQLEMLEESMRRNIIVAVRLSSSLNLQRLIHSDGNWVRKDICVHHLYPLVRSISDSTLEPLCVYGQS